jgi:hypothetical protein
LTTALAISSSVSIIKPGPPSTPPRCSQPRDKLALLLSKPRQVETTAPLSSFNPFSPAKNKGKQKENSRNENETHSHLAKEEAKALDKSLDPFPVFSPKAFASTSEPSLPPLNNAVARARKRLRGDPVSPSPNKQKRRRVGSQTSLPFSKLNLKPPISDDSDHEEESIAGEADSSFIDDSPVKVPAGGKSFKILFEESIPPNKGTSSKRKTTPTGGVFGEQLQREISVDGGCPRGSNSVVRRKIVNGQSFARRLLPEKRNTLPEDVSNTANLAKSMKTYPEHRTLSKRRLTNPDDDSEPLHSASGLQPTLLPPSPPPADVSNRYSKAKETTKSQSRKKAKVDRNAEDEVSETSEDDKIKVADLRRRRQLGPNGDVDDFELDPVLNRRHTYELANGMIEEGSFEVSLPDKLWSVLALSPSNSRSSKDERIVSDLLYGHGKFCHRGAEIWRVGEEIAREVVDSEGENEWEGEAVPWEVGEM